MRLRRIRLKNYRGIEASEVCFEDGITVIEGPNEVGKSSLHEALGLLLARRDSSKSADVRAVKPVDRDVGPEVEVDLETGPYHLTYFKRFLRHPETVLTVRTPRPENRTGRAAHDRVEEILAETLDKPLWDALRVKQGAAVGQSPLHEIHALAHALDVAAGNETTGDTEQSLYDLVRAEYLRYYTETGQQKKAFSVIEAKEEETAGAVAQLRSELAALEQDVARSSQLERQIVETEQGVRDGEATLKRHREEIAELEQRLAELNRRRTEQTIAATGELVARKERLERRRLIEKLETLQRQREELEATVMRRRPARREAEDEAKDAREAMRTAGEAARAAEDIAHLRAKDFDFHRAKLDYDQLLERRDRIREAQRGSAEAQQLLDTTPTTDALLHRIEEAQLAHVAAEARLQADSPRLVVKAEADLLPEIDGHPVPLAAGEELDRAVPEVLHFRVPGVADITISAGTGTSDRYAARDLTRRELDDLLTQAGVACVDTARQANASRRRAADTVEQTRTMIEQDRRDLTLEEMEAKILRLERWVTGYPHERIPQPPLARHYEEAKDHRQRSREAQRHAVLGLDDARRRLEDARERRDQLRTDALEFDLRHKLAGNSEQAGATELEHARRAQTDDALDVAWDEARSQSRIAQHSFAKEEQAVRSVNPERKKQLAMNAEQAVDQARRRLRELQDEQRQVAGRLEAKGERGLFEALEDARTVHERATYESQATGRRAGAARLLFDTMSMERENARRAYAAPLRDKVNTLGRLVFDETFHVDLADDLAVATRTLQGRTLPFQDLSVGAQEQLSLIHRVACALLVNKEDGVPLVFDDTLGHSDPERLEGMGAMLARAGERCQIIILTCTPGRFRHIGNANYVRL